MPVHSAGVGAATEPYVVDVTPRMTMAFAAGVADANLRYLDDVAEGGIIAPPPFCASLEWPVTLAVRALPALNIPDEDGLRAVHATQDSTFHRPIRPGDRLRTTGTVIGVRAIKPGALLSTKMATVDDATGAPVTTTYMGAIYRGVAVEGGDAEAETPPALASAAQLASPVHAALLHVAAEAAHVYTECAQIWNPIHTERAVAQLAGLPNIILHGTAIWALAARELVNRCAGGDPTRLRRLAGRFAAMIIPDSTIAVEYAPAPENPGTYHYTVRNAAGDPAISHGVAEITT